MPSNLTILESGFPTFTGEETAQQQILALHNYLFQLREGLRYSMKNLTADNFNAVALQNMTDAQKDAMTEQLTQVYSALNEMGNKVAAIIGRVSDAEGRISAAEEETAGLENRVGTTESDIRSIKKDVSEAEGRITAAEGEIDRLENRVGTTESDIHSIEKDVSEVETDVKDLNARVAKIEDELPALEQAADDLAVLEEQVAGQDQEIRKVGYVVKVADDGSATIGVAGNVLNLIGTVYINGALYEQGGTA